MSSAFFQFVLGLRSVVLATKKSSGKTCVEVFFPLTNLLMCDGTLIRWIRWGAIKTDGQGFLPGPPPRLMYKTH
jgi:hypothetical protein